MSWWVTVTQVGGLAGWASFGATVINGRRDSRKAYTDYQREKRGELVDILTEVRDLSREALIVSDDGSTFMPDGVRADFWTRYNALVELERTLIVPNENHIDVLRDAINDVMSYAINPIEAPGKDLPPGEQEKLLKPFHDQYQNKLRLLRRVMDRYIQRLDNMTKGKRFASYPLKSRYTLPRGK